MTAHYADEQVTLYAGDCLDVLRSLPDCSVDACITDPPYGLSDLKPAQVTAAIVAWASGDRENVPDARGFMGRSWDAFVPPPAVWDECYRVLKPGGHIAAFAGSRTYDLMGLSIRLAGFEIRDGLQWLYGSGFPKSMDVSKAIDKQRDDRGEVERVRVYLDAARGRAGVTRRQVAEAFGVDSRMVQKWMGAKPDSQAHCPTWEQWGKLRDLLGFGDEMDAEVWRLNGRKGAPGEAWDQREVIGQSAHKPGIANGTAGHYTVGGTIAKHVDITAPATDGARQWQGWGTALKPAHEPIVCAQKPFNAVPSWDVVNTLHHALGGLLWLSASPAKRAELSSTSSPHALPEDACASALADAVLGTSRGKSATTATFNSQALASTSSNIATSWSAILAALSGQTRTFTTATASSTTTALQTLNSLLAPITSPTTMPRCECLTGGGTSPAQSADDSSSDAWARWRHTQSASAPESAIEGIALAVSSALASVAEQLSNEQAAASTAQQSAQTGPPMSGGSSLSGLANAAGSSSSLAETLAASVRSTAQGSPSTAGSRPAHEPIVLARKPLAGTVAANVLQFGTGALNLDATRVGATPSQRPMIKAWDDAVSLCNSCASAAEPTPKLGTPATRACTATKHAGPTTNEKGETPPLDTSKTGTGCSDGTSAEAGGSTSSSTGVSGKTPTGQSLTGTSSTTSTTIRSTTGSKTCASCAAEITPGTTSVSRTSTPMGEVPPSTPGSGAAAGRWPSNVLLTHAPDCDDSACQPGSCPVSELDAQSGALHTQNPATRRSAKATGGEIFDMPGMSACYADPKGSGASRYFPTFRYQAKAGKAERPKVDGVAHSTVKPLAVMSWLVKLLTPPGGTVLEPFAGSGTTIEAAMLEGFRVIGIEREADYLPLIEHRIARARETAAQPEEAAPALFDIGEAS